MENQRIRTYSELVSIEDFDERLKYLRLFNDVGVQTFGQLRWLNQSFYSSKIWKQLRDEVMLRDSDSDYIYDLAHRSVPIIGEKPYVHHLNPITPEMIEANSPLVYDPEYLVVCSRSSHDFIHYGKRRWAARDYKQRTPNDTCPWKT